MKKIVLFALSLLFTLLSSVAYAQGCDDDGDEGSDDEGKPKIFGFIQPQFEYHFTEIEKNNAFTNLNHNSFKFKRARIGIKGNIPYDFKYYVVLENSSFVSRTGNPYLLDAFISYSRFKWFKVSVGSFKQPFGLEVNTACHGLHTIQRAAVSDQIVAPQRDMGIMILGGTNETLFKYALALMNGNGLGTKDNNNKKDIIGRLTIKPLDYIRFGGSFRYGFPESDGIKYNLKERISLAAELEVNYNQFLFQSEYIMDYGAYNTSSGGGCGADPLLLGEIRGGFYAQAMYMTGFNIQPVVKFEFFDQDYSNDGNISAIDNFTTITGGINYFFNEKTRLQVNYLYNVEKGKEVPNDALLIQLQIKY